nr:hypothetical protein HAGR004_01320 [Bdellovibrio sp. HAGR004]
MNNFANMFVDGFLIAGIPTGIAAFLVWLGVRRDPIKAVVIGTSFPLIGGLFGFIGAIPCLLFIGYFALKGQTFTFLKRETEAPDLESKIIKLKKMKDSGLLSEAEFEMAKKEAISKSA